MKNLFTLLLFAFSLVAFSQSGTSKNDIIITKDGELIQAKVLKVTSNTISFSYPGETVVNELEKVGLEKIVFSSGRTQTFANGTSASTSQPKAVVPIPKEVPPIPKEEIYLNLDPVEASIAVIPASFTLNSSYNRDLSSNLSTYISDYLSKTTTKHGLAVQDMKETIKNLVDSGIGFQELKSTSLTDLRNTLKTEFLLKASIEETKQKATPVKKGFYGDRETPSESGFTEIAIKLKAFGADSEKEIFDVSVIFDITEQSETDIETEWQSLMEFVMEQLIESNNLK